MIVQLLNGCMLLVTTLPLLLQLLDGNHFKLTELQILVMHSMTPDVSCAVHVKYRWLMSVIRWS